MNNYLDEILCNANDLYKRIVELTYKEYGESVWVDLEICNKANYVIVRMENGRLKSVRMISFEQIRLGYTEVMAEVLFEEMNMILCRSLR